MSHSMYDIESEEETIHVLRAQNKKIKDLYNELEKKDDIIYRMQNDTSQYDEYQSHLINNKTQIARLEEKIKLLEKALQDSNQISNDHLKKASEIESMLRHQLKTKERIIQEQSESIKYLDSQLNTAREELSDKNISLNKYKTNHDELNISMKTNVNKLSRLEDDNLSIIKQNEYLKSEMNKTKIRFDDKAQGLVELIKQQNNELSRATSNLIKTEKENSQLKSINTQYKIELEDLLQNLNEMKGNLIKFHNIEDRVLESEKMIEDLHNLLESERAKNKEFCSKLENVNEKNSEIVKSISELEDICIMKDSEIRNLQNRIDVYKQALTQKDVSLKQNESDNIQIMSNVNDFLITSMQWIDTYLGLYINTKNSKISVNKSFSVPELSYDIVIQNKNFQDNPVIKSQLENFINLLHKVQQRINDEMVSFEEAITEVKYSLTIQKEKADELSRENTKLKSENIEMTETLRRERESIIKLKKEMKTFQERFEYLEHNQKITENSFNKFLSEILKEFKDTYKQIKDDPRLFHYADFIFKHTLNENMIDQTKDYIDNFINMIHSMIQDISLSINKIEELNKIKSECDSVKSQFESFKQKSKKEIASLIEEKNNSIAMSERKKYEEIQKLEDEYKVKFERLKSESVDKDEYIENTIQENTLLKNQMEMIEKNFENFKLIKKENEYSINNFRKDLMTKCEEMIQQNKKLAVELNLKTENN